MPVRIHRIAILGERESGKTSFVRRLQGAEISKNYFPTNSPITYNNITFRGRLFSITEFPGLCDPSLFDGSIYFYTSPFAIKDISQINVVNFCKALLLNPRYHSMCTYRNEGIEGPILDYLSR